MKKFFTPLISLIILFYGIQVLAQEQVSNLSGQVPEGYNLLFEDNFNQPGKPSATDWLFRNNKKAGGLSLPANSTINSGCLQIKYTYDASSKAGEQFRGGGVVSTHNFGYGYYEARIKFYGGTPNQSGFHQSFWSMGLTGTNEAEGAGVRDSLVGIDAIPRENRVLEIDAIELESKHNSLDQNYHVYSPVHNMEYPENGKIAKDLSKWVVMGYEWLPDRINFYCDGKYFATKKLDGIWKLFVPQNVWFTALPVEWAGGMSIPKEDAMMQVDYFRFYARKLPGTNRIGNEGFEYGEKGNTYPIGWIVAHNESTDKTISKVVTDSTKAFTGTRYLSIQNSAANKATVKQIVEYIPNGKYTLSAYVKSSGGQENASLTINSGDISKIRHIMATDQWTKISIENIEVANNQATIEIRSDAGVSQWLLIDQVEFCEQKSDDWANLGHYKEANMKLGAASANEKRVVFYGNSITDLWIVRSPDFFSGKPYLDRGIGGQTTPQMLVRFRTDVINLKPKVVEILADINDIAENTGPTTLDAIEGNIASMAELAKTNGIKVILSSVLPANKFPWRPEIDPVNKIIALNKWIKEYSLKNNIQYVDYYSSMVDEQKGMKKEMTKDGVHPNLTGYKVMEPLVEKAILKY